MNERVIKLVCYRVSKKRSQFENTVFRVRSILILVTWVEDNHFQMSVELTLNVE